MQYQHEQHFSSFEEFNGYPHGWDAHFSSTSSANYEVRLRQSVAPGMIINTAWLSGSTLQQASTPEDMRTFALPLQLPNTYSWRGLPVDELTFMSFPSDRELFSVMGADSEVLTLSLVQESVDDCLRSWELDPEVFFDLPRTAVLTAPQHAKLCRDLRLLSEFMMRYSADDRFTQLSLGMQEYLVETMLAPVTTELVRATVVTPGAVRRVNKAAEYMLAHLGEPITVAGLAQQVGCSRRSLEQSFKRYAGTSPKRFLQLTRLESCRRALLRADPADQVAPIARQFGFWHMGQFSADYRRRYGERPSITLARRNRVQSVCS